MHADDLRTQQAQWEAECRRRAALLRHEPVADRGCLWTCALSLACWAGVLLTVWWAVTR